MGDTLLWSNEYLEDEQYDRYMHIEEANCLLKILKHKINKPAIWINAYHIAWNNSSGHKIVFLNKDAEDLYNDLIPSANTFKLFQEKDTEKLYAVVSSHDVPIGSTWWLYGLENVDKICEQLHYYTKLTEITKYIKSSLNIDIDNWSRKVEIVDGIRYVTIGKDKLVLAIKEDKILSIIYNAENIAVEYYKTFVGMEEREIAKGEIVISKYKSFRSTD